MKKMFAIVLALMLCVSALSVVAFAAEGDTVVHAKVPAEWTAPNVYGWTDPNGNPAWPGTAMTADGEWWTGTIDAANDRVIINNSDGSSGPQTVDITIEAGKEVWLVLSGDGTGASDYTVYYEEPVAGDDTNDDTTNDDTTNDDTTTEDNTTNEQPAADAAYYVAGFAALCNGKEWDAGAVENKMTKGEDGSYSITYTGVAAGSYELKVTAGNWDTCWGNSSGDNVKFTIDAAADITVKFNPETGKITVLNGENPITGDMSLAAVSVALLAATAGLVVTVSKKKEF